LAERLAGFSFQPSESLLMPSKPEAGKPALGRPSTYTTQIADRICVRLALGESLNKITRDADMPCQSTVYVWLLKHPEFVEKYERARGWQADTLVDQTIDIADDATNDWMMTATGDGAEAYRLNGENIQRSRLRIDQRKWYAGKVAPKKYGDKLDLTHAGEVTLNHKDAAADEARRKLAALIAPKKGKGVDSEPDEG
jgi:hypothetical protein